MKYRSKFLKDVEKELFYRELDSFIPHKIFDSHGHLYEKPQFPKNCPESRLYSALSSAPDSVTLSEYRRQMEQIMPDRHIDGCFFPMVFKGDIQKINEFISSEVSNDPNCCGQMLIHPDMDPEFIRQEVHRLKFCGLKCYHTTSSNLKHPSFLADIISFLPEEHVRIAHEEKLTITLHIVKNRALADLKNQQTIRYYCEKYPNMKMVLAHAARGFNPHHTVEGIGSIRGLKNIWFDTSCVCDGGALEAIMMVMGHQRLLYGSDFPITHLRGRCVGIGDSFLWLYEDTLDWPKIAVYAKLQPVLIGLESLRCLKLATLHLKLTDKQIENIFYNNARQLYGF